MHHDFKKCEVIKILTLEKSKKQVIIIVAVKNTAPKFIKEWKGAKSPFPFYLFKCIIYRMRDNNISFTSKINFVSNQEFKQVVKKVTNTYLFTYTDGQNTVLLLTHFTQKESGPVQLAELKERKLSRTTHKRC